MLVAVLAWALAALVGNAVEQADDARLRWGRTTTVWVADRALTAGEPFAGAVRSRPWPAGLVPEAALRSIPRRARAAGPVDPGTPLTGAAVERPPVARRTISIPVPEAGLPVEVGDRVDVWATADPAAVADDRGQETRRVASAARVVRSGDRAVVIEVRPAQVESVADAAASATITLVGVP